MQKLTRHMISAVSILALVVGSVLLGASAASADRQASAVEVVVLSDDIRKGETRVLSAADVAMDMSDPGTTDGGTTESGGDTVVTGDGTTMTEGDGTTTVSGDGTTTTTTTTTDGNDDNRSGLGDGTNPGQGGGTANATNEGTYNPHHVRHTGRSGGRR